jgi:hypothetical protein
LPLMEVADQPPFALRCNRTSLRINLSRRRHAFLERGRVHDRRPHSTRPSGRPIHAPMSSCALRGLTTTFATASVRQLGWMRFGPLECAAIQASNRRHVDEKSGVPYRPGSRLDEQDMAAGRLIETAIFAAESLQQRQRSPNSGAQGSRRNSQRRDSTA